MMLQILSVLQVIKKLKNFKKQLTKYFKVCIMSTYLEKRQTKNLINNQFTI